MANELGNVGGNGGIFLANVGGPNDPFVPPVTGNAIQLEGSLGLIELEDASGFILLEA